MYRKHLLQMGIMADIKGFEFLNYAIEIYEPSQQMMVLYMEVAKKFDTTPSRAERAMRHALTRAKQKMTVGQFVSKYKILWRD